MVFPPETLEYDVLPAVQELKLNVCACASKERKLLKSASPVHFTHERFWTLYSDENEVRMAKKFVYTKILAKTV